MIVRETNLNLGKVGSVKDFLLENDITKDDHICFDEVICLNNSKIFLDAIVKLKNHVSSLWIAMGSSHQTINVDLPSKYGFVCPKLQYPLRNPLEIINYVTKSMKVPNGASSGNLLCHKVDVGEITNMTDGQLHEISDQFLNVNAALKVRFVD